MLGEGEGGVVRGARPLGHPAQGSLSAGPRLEDSTDGRGRAVQESILDLVLSGGGVPRRGEGEGITTGPGEGEGLNHAGICTRLF